MSHFLKTAIALFLLFATPFIDNWWHGGITGFSVLAGVILAFWLWVRLVTWRSAGLKRDERLLRRAEAHKLADHYRSANGQKGESCGWALLLGLGFVVLALFVLTALCRAADVSGLDAELRTLTAELQPQVLLTAEELDSVRALTMTTGLLIRKMQTQPVDMPAEIGNRRIRVRTILQGIQDSLITVTVDHASTILRHMPR
jgi:hypothetical protein